MSASLPHRQPLYFPFIHRSLRLSHLRLTMSSPGTHITSVLKETRSFPPPPAFSARALVKSLAEYEALFEKAKNDPEGFWAEQARMLDWIAPWSKVLEWQEPHAKWFVGGKLNVSANCLDRH